MIATRIVHPSLGNSDARVNLPRSASRIGLQLSGLVLIIN